MRRCCRPFSQNKLLPHPQKPFFYYTFFPSVNQVQNKKIRRISLFPPDPQEDKKEAVYEIADLAYHVMVLMVEAGISLEDIQKELASRHVIDKKVKQEKMTH